MRREGTSDLPFPAWSGVILTLLLILVDQGTKLLALSQLKGNPDIILIPGVLQLKYLENRGACMECGNCYRFTRMYTFI